MSVFGWNGGGTETGAPRATNIHGEESVIFRERTVRPFLLRVKLKRVDEGELDGENERRELISLRG